MLTTEQCALFETQGYLHISRVFDQAEIEDLRRIAGSLTRGAIASEYFYKIPELREFWADRRLVGIAKQLLGEPISYFFSGHILRYDFTQGDVYNARHLHHDAKGTKENLYNRLNTSLDHTFPVLRFGIYLQDTLSQSGGLKVAPGSHRRDVSSFAQSDVALENLGTRPGDVVVFTQRLLHSPLALRLRDDPTRVLTPNEEDALFASQPQNFLPIPDLRQTIFIDYAAQHPEADLFVKNRAVVSTEADDNLSRFLVDDGYLDQHTDSDIEIRVDRAIVETIANAARRAQGGQIDQEGIAILARLPRLCHAHRESSPYHQLHAAKVPDLTLSTAERLYYEIAQRIAVLRQQEVAPSRVREMHMGPSPTANARALDAMYSSRVSAKSARSLVNATAAETGGYDPRFWGQFNRVRRLQAPARKLLASDSKIFTMGSCFAMQIRRAMSQRGLSVYPDYAAVAYDRTREVFDKIPEREALQHYDTFTMRQEFEAALGDWPDRAAGYWPVRDAAVNTMLQAPEVYQDPYRKLVYAATRDGLAILADRITGVIRDGLAASNLVVLTLGLTEVWRHKVTGKYLCRPPGTGYGGGFGLADFQQSTFEQNYDNVRATLDLLLAQYPDKQVVISVSPIALEATFSAYDVGTANTESKAVLRAVAGQICREYAANVTYFPSYEMATILGLDAFDDDGRHVRQAFADQVVTSFVDMLS